MNTWGGKRENSGAKKKKAKKPITLYLHTDEVDRIGGRDEVRYILYAKWEEELGLKHGEYYNHTKQAK